MSPVLEGRSIRFSFRAHSPAGYSRPELDPTDQRPVFTITQDEAIAPCDWKTPERAPPGFLFEGRNTPR